MREATTDHFIDDYGVSIFYRHWPVENPKAAIVVSHGASEHSGRYDRFAKAMNSAGYEVFAADQRGHGHTRDSTGVGRCGPGGADGLLNDLEKLVAAATEASGSKPVVLLGHSLGSMIAQGYATRGAKGLSGYILSGPVGAPEGGQEMLDGLRAAVDAGMSDEALDALGSYNQAFEPARTPYDWLSRDEAEVDAYIADDFCGSSNPLTYGLLCEVIGLAVPSVTPEAIRNTPAIPVLLLAGEMDPVGAMAANVRELQSRLVGEGLDVTACYYPGARHEVLNETNRAEVQSDIVAWLDGHIAQTG
jgi:alpha-beta hydrolase superfamily lysophospholipase